MYKKAIDILMDENKNLRKIAIQIAKSNPSVFVKATEKIYGRITPTAIETFELKNGERFQDTLSISKGNYIGIVNKIGYEPWAAEIMSLLFDFRNENPGKIKAIKAHREHTEMGLRESKHFIESLIENYWR